MDLNIQWEALREGLYLLQNACHNTYFLGLLSDMENEENIKTIYQ